MAFAEDDAMGGFRFFGFFFWFGASVWGLGRRVAMNKKRGKKESRRQAALEATGETRQRGQDGDVCS